MRRDPRNRIGKQIRDELKAARMTYSYACRVKIRREHDTVKPGNQQRKDNPV